MWWWTFCDQNSNTGKIIEQVRIEVDIDRTWEEYKENIVEREVNHSNEEAENKEETSKLQRKENNSNDKANKCRKKFKYWKEQNTSNEEADNAKKTLNVEGTGDALNEKELKVKVNSKNQTKLQEKRNKR